MASGSNKTLFIVIGLVAFCLMSSLCAGLGFIAFNKYRERAQSGTSATPAADATVEVRSPGGNFTARFPGPPTESTSEVPIGEGRPPVVSHTSTWGTNERSVSLSYNYYDDNQIGAGATIEGVIEATRDAMVQGSNATLVRQASITVQGHPALDMWMTLAAQPQLGTMRGRVIIAGRRVYVMALIGPDAMIEAFLASFVLGPPTDPFVLPHRGPDGLPAPSAQNGATAPVINGNGLSPTGSK